MNSESNNRIAAILSKTISIVLHPVLMPLYMVAVLMSNGLLLTYATPQARLYFFVVIILNTVLVPGICIFLFNRLKFWRDNPNGDFRERILPMLVMIISYTACIIMIKDAPFAYPVRKMLIAGTGSLIMAFITTFFWRISLHMTAQGAAVAFIALLIASGADKLMWVLCLSIACAAVVASARLYLGKHDPAQVAAGFLGGFAITFLSVFIM